MAEDEDPTEGAEAEDRTDWKAEARKWEDRAKSNAQAAKRLAELDEQTKTAEQKHAEARAAAEKERDEARLALMKRDAAEEAGLPRSWADRLRGATAEELLADAKALAKDVAPAQQPRSPRPVADLKPGALPAGTPTTAQSASAEIDEWIRDSARRRR